MKTAVATKNAADAPRRSRLTWLALGALGVVYGDIGTSPLYAFKECFAPESAYGIAPTHANVLGVLSLMIWSLIVVVSIKYIGFVMQADNRGEGGIMALLSLLLPAERVRRHPKALGLLTSLGLFGTALLYGEGIITPAITTLSAIEGLKVATPLFEPYVVPVTVLVLVGLFSLQRHGTTAVGRVFGPVMAVWFGVIALLGLVEVWRGPDVLEALHPAWAGRFFATHGRHAFAMLGAVIFVVTGVEALYADMGHFGKRPIRLAWFAVVFPALILNYLGQGALLLGNPAAAVNPFFSLAPVWGVLPLVGLSTLAAVIASQALISGAYSITMQSIQLGFCPRMQVEHTSALERGQIYIPLVNGWLMLACIGLVLGFGSSSRLAAAYGVAVALVMTITTILFSVLAIRVWRWNPWVTCAGCGLLLLIELSFVSANIVKITSGAWFPLAVGAILFVLMSTWRRGRKILADRFQSTSLPLDFFLENVREHPPQRVRGTAVFLSGSPAGTPPALLHNLKHNLVLHERVVIMTIATSEVPHVREADRVSIESLGENVFRVIGRFGFMEDPEVPPVLAACAAAGLEIEEERATFFLSRETLIPSGRGWWPTVFERLFIVLARNAQSPAAFFRLPANRVVELGMQIRL